MGGWRGGFTSFRLEGFEPGLVERKKNGLIDLHPPSDEIRTDNGGGIKRVFYHSITDCCGDQLFPIGCTRSLRLKKKPNCVFLPACWPDRLPAYLTD